MNSRFSRSVFSAVFALTISCGAHAGSTDVTKPLSLDQMNSNAKFPESAQAQTPTTTVSELANLESSFAKTPNNVNVVSQLALAYIRRAQRTGQRDYINYARLILQPWIDAQDVPENVLLPRAYLFIDDHNTDAALVDLKALEKIRPLDAQVKLASALIYQDRQEFKPAIAACYKVSQLSSAEIASACMASVFLAMDQPVRAKPLLQAIEPVVLGLGSDIGAATFGLATEIWVLKLLTKLAIQQREPFAESYYRAELAERNAVYEEQVDIYL